MNILLISCIQNSNDKKQAPGGIASWTKHYLKLIKDTGNKCELVNNAIIGKRKSDFKRYSIIDEILRFYRIRKDLNISLKHNVFKVAHINDSCSPFGVIRDYYLIKRISKEKIPVIVHFHCDVKYQIEHWSKYINKISLIYFKKILSNSSGIITLGKISCEFLKDNYNVDSVIIPNFVDISSILLTRKKISPVINNVLFVGQVTEEKGINELIEAAQMTPKVKYCIIGSSNESMKSRLAKISNIDYLGVKKHSEINKYLACADVFLLPSHSEGFSMALLEAMSQGVPCIATNVGANKDMIENKGGIIINVNKPIEIKKAIEKMSDCDTREYMSNWNLKKVQMYSSDKVIGEYIEFYRNIYNNGEE